MVSFLPMRIGDVNMVHWLVRMTMNLSILVYIYIMRYHSLLHYSLVHVFDKSNSSDRKSVV